ncbi:solute carrier family 35 member F1-like [Brassica napus]|uniref:solute carrier family 35 member F1-like n=1 Tax=Brassica napus TaxID=3708 RepID=UPI00207A5D1B|nr:solute carrier family 35 member F1-like [Brassica napus]
MENPRESLKSTTQEVHLAMPKTGKWYHYCLFALADVEANFLGDKIIVGQVKCYYLHHILAAAVVVENRGSIMFCFFVVVKANHSMKITGVALCILGVVMVVFSNVHRRESRRCIFERGELKAVEWSAENPLPFPRFAVSMFLSYSLLPVLLKTSGSAMFTLSLLTSDMWAVLIRIFAYHEKFDWLYYLAFATTAIVVTDVRRYRLADG